MNDQTDSQHPAEEEKPLNFFQVTFSVIAAAIGVQKSENRERDFSRGSPLVFIAAGLIFTTVFVLTIIGVVYLVL